MHIFHFWPMTSPPFEMIFHIWVCQRLCKSITKIKKKEQEIISKKRSNFLVQVGLQVREPDLMHPITPIVQWCSNAESSITRFHNISIATPSNVINQIKTVWRKMIIQMSFDENWWYCLMAMEHMRGIDWVLCFHYFHYYMVVYLYCRCRKIFH